MKGIQNFAHHTMIDGVKFSKLPEFFDEPGWRRVPVIEEPLGLFAVSGKSLQPILYAFGAMLRESRLTQRCKAL